MNAPAVKFHIRVARMLFRRRYRHLKSLRREERRGYSLIPFDKHRCMFVHIPKAAGISVSRKLFGCLGGGHTPLVDYAHVFSADEFKDYFKFTFVRNPWDRLLSAYMFLRSGGLNGEDTQWAARHLAPYADFNDFVMGWVNENNIWTKLHFYPQSYFLTLDGRLAVDFIGRFEHIDDDFAYIAARLGINSRLEHLNSSGERNYRDYYSQESADVVARVYREDIALLAYRF